MHRSISVNIFFYFLSTNIRWTEFRQGISSLTQPKMLVENMLLKIRHLVLIGNYFFVEYLLPIILGISRIFQFI